MAKLTKKQLKEQQEQNLMLDIVSGNNSALTQIESDLLPLNQNLSKIGQFELKNQFLNLADELEKANELIKRNHIENISENKQDAKKQLAEYRKVDKVLSSIVTTTTKSYKQDIDTLRAVFKTEVERLDNELAKEERASKEAKIALLMPTVEKVSKTEETKKALVDFLNTENAKGQLTCELLNKTYDIIEAQKYLEELAVETYEKNEVYKQVDITLNVNYNQYMKLIDFLKKEAIISEDN